MKIRFNYVDRKLGISPNSLFKELIKNLFDTEQVDVDYIDYIFCSDDYLLEINRNSLNHDYYTDIITFPLNEKKMPVQAEIYISIDRVKDNAITHNTTYKGELSRVIAHGALHLCGYKDKTPRDIALMREKESFYISKM